MYMKNSILTLINEDNHNFNPLFEEYDIINISIFINISFILYCINCINIFLSDVISQCKPPK